MWNVYEEVVGTSISSIVELMQIYVEKRLFCRRQQDEVLPVNPRRSKLFPKCSGDRGRRILLPVVYVFCTVVHVDSLGGHISW